MPKWVNVALRAVGGCLALTCGYLVWKSPSNGWTITLSAIVAMFLGRMIARARLVPNPLGEGARDFSLRPVWRNVVKGVACSAGSLVWAWAGGLAFRYHYLPDTRWAAYGLVGVPLVGLILVGAWFMLVAMPGTMFGRRPNANANQT